eukprot:TRINITY_DN37355_c0_g1_i1.p1 TRINITY_DN37355_c0_g1~~TRINITY_DN37355_c0_g1_i1.p1  ORF type:complete len:205 (+),score=22.78 TRINITY_DN37355_c0_g1_i1:80-694(+)
MAYPSRRNPVLTPMDHSRASLVDASSVCSAACSPQRIGNSPKGFRSPSSLPASRPSSCGSFTRADMHLSRSTSASSHRSEMHMGSTGGAGELLSTIADTESQDSLQNEIVLKAMVPIVKRAMVSKNRAVFQSSLESMRHIERMFGKEAIDQHIETLVESLEKQCGQTCEDHRAKLVFDTMTSLCSKDMADILRQRFPNFAATVS